MKTIWDSAQKYSQRPSDKYRDLETIDTVYFSNLKVVELGTEAGISLS